MNFYILSPIPIRFLLATLSFLLICLSLQPIMSQIPDTAPQIDRFMKPSTAKSDWQHDYMQEEIAGNVKRGWNGTFYVANGGTAINSSTTNCEHCSAFALSLIQQPSLPDDLTQLNIPGGKLDTRTPATYDSLVTFAADPTRPNLITHAVFKIENGYVASVHSPCVSNSHLLCRSDVVEVSGMVRDGRFMSGEEEVWLTDQINQKLEALGSNANRSDFVNGIVVPRPSGADWITDSAALQNALVDGADGDDDADDDDPVSWAFRRHRNTFIDGNDEAVFLAYASAGAGDEVEAHMFVLFMIGDEIVCIDLQQSMANSSTPVAQSVLPALSGTVSPEFVCTDCFL